jgi:guanosine-3',5'-bis(diphosphate) 3'-pyrophosphohydrolase
MNNQELAKLTAQWFDEAGKKYGDEPYSVHNEEVRAVLRRFGFIDQTGRIHERHYYLHTAALLHDVFEDCPHVSPGRVIALGVNVSAVAIALLLTDEQGENRRIRKLKTYENIKFCDHALIVKLADRIANVERGGKLDMYRKEHPEFRDHLYKKPAGELPWQEETIEKMWHFLDDMLISVAV